MAPMTTNQQTARSILNELVDSGGLLSLCELDARLPGHGYVAIADAVSQLAAVGLAHQVGPRLCCATAAARAADDLLS